VWSGYCLKVNNRVARQIFLSFIQGDLGRKIRVLGGAIVSIIARKKFMWTCIKFCMVTELQLFESGAQT